jgi:ABC-type Fe3+-citrate transport system substrate-binding protein
VFKKELPWTGIALVVTSISTLVLSIRVAFLSAQINQLQTFQVELVKSDRLAADNCVANANLHKTVCQRLDNIEKYSPANCLKEHMNLYKEHVDALLLIKKLTERIESLEHKMSKQSSTFKVIK